MLSFSLLLSDRLATTIGRTRRLCTSQIFAWLTVGCLALLVPSAPAVTFTVTSTSDTYIDPQNPPTGTLRWAILQANHTAGPDTITFSIPAGGSPVKTITLTTISPPPNSYLDELYVSDSVVIDATTQQGYSGTPLVEINCDGRNQAFFVTGHGGITIRGFILNRFASNGITIWEGSNGDSILDNWIGLDQTGLGAFPDPNLTRGIGIQSSGNLIHGNTISGIDNGIIIGFASSPDFRCTYNVITGNRIGTDPTGTTRVGITGDGIFLFGGAAFNTIGPDNVISGVGSTGCELLDGTNQYNRVIGNIFGLDVTGRFPIPNHDSGLLLSNGAKYNYVADNTISNNGIAGIIIGTAGAFYSGIGNTIEHNNIGTDVTGTIPMPGGQFVGIQIGTNRSYWNIIRYNVIVASTEWGLYLQDTMSNEIQGNKVGITPSGTPAGNGADGIYLQGSSWNTIVGNDVEYNGFGDLSFGGWMGIRLDGGSLNNTVSGNFVAHNLNDTPARLPDRSQPVPRNLHRSREARPPSMTRNSVQILDF